MEVVVPDTYKDFINVLNSHNWTPLPSRNLNLVPRLSTHHSDLKSLSYLKDCHGIANNEQKSLLLSNTNLNARPSQTKVMKCYLNKLSPYVLNY